MNLFIEDTFERLKGKTIGLLRADSGFFDNSILEFLEDETKPINYIIAGKFYAPMKERNNIAETVVKNSRRQRDIGSYLQESTMEKSPKNSNSKTINKDTSKDNRGRTYVIY